MEDAETNIRSFKRKGKIKITNKVDRLVTSAQYVVELKRIFFILVGAENISQRGRDISAPGCAGGLTNKLGAENLNKS